MEKSGEVRLEKRRRENEKKSRNKRELAGKAPRTRRKFRLGTVRGICHPHVTCRGEPGPFALSLSSNGKTLFRLREFCAYFGGTNLALYFRNCSHF